MKTRINNIDDLKSEITRVNLLKREQEAFLSQQYVLLRKKVQAPARVFGALSSAIPGVDLVKGLFSSISATSKGQVGADKGKESDWLTRTIQLGLPLVLNKTLLRNASWIKKSLVLLASETAAGQINQNTVSGVISKLTNFVKPKKKKKHKNVASLEEKSDVHNFGIPPDSETY